MSQTKARCSFPYTLRVARRINLAPAELPHGRPAVMFAGRFHTQVEAGFILISRWDFRFYGIP
jgi:hypothetical protein